MLSLVSQMLNAFFNKCGFVTHLFLALMLTVLLSACGGGGGGGGSVPPPEPEIILEDANFEIRDGLLVVLAGGNSITVNSSYFDVLGDINFNNLDDNVVLTLTGTIPTGITVTTTGGEAITLSSSYTITTTYTAAITITQNHLPGATVSLGHNVSDGLVTNTLSVLTITSTVTESEIEEYMVTMTNTVTHITGTLFTLTATTSLTLYYPKYEEYTLTILTTLTQTSPSIPDSATIVGTITNTIAYSAATVTTYNVTNATITVVTVTGLVHVDSKGDEFKPSEVVYVYHDLDGGFSFIDSYDYHKNFDMLMAQGITLPSISFTLTVGSGTSTLAVDISTYIYTIAVTNTVNTTMTVTVTVGTTTLTTDVYTITTGTQTVFSLMTITATITNSITLNVSNYVLLTNIYIPSTTTSTLTLLNIDYEYNYQSYGITLGYNADGQVDYLILPPSSSSSTIDFDTAEYQENWGLAAIGAKTAYERGYFGQGVTVAVVDTGVKSLAQLTANIVPGIRYSLNKFFTTNIGDEDGHGTFVAGIIAGERDDYGIHGVAPSVNILPIQVGVAGGGGGLYGNTGLDYVLTTQVATHQAHIINNSWGTSEKLYGIYEGQTVVATVPLFKQFVDFDNWWSSQKDAVYYGDWSESQDIVAVFAAGNDYWNTETTVFGFCQSKDAFSLGYSGCGKDSETPYTYVSTEDFLKNFEALAHTVVLNFKLVTYADYGKLATLNINSNSPGYYPLLPMYDDRLLGKYVVVVATDANNNIASFSNGCGEAKMWCMAAPGVDIKSLGLDGNVITGSGTSYAAPHVSGALAVLRSRLPMLPMSVALDMLFYTATDLGDKGIDDVYGHGLLNLDAAITVQGSIALVQEKLLVSLPTVNYAEHPEYNWENNEDSFNAMGVAEAWNLGYFGVKATVAMIDTMLYGNWSPTFGADLELRTKFKYATGFATFFSQTANRVDAVLMSTGVYSDFSASYLNQGVTDATSGSYWHYAAVGMPLGDPRAIGHHNFSDVAGVAPRVNFLPIILQADFATYEESSNTEGVMRESVLEAMRFMATVTASNYSAQVVNLSWSSHMPYQFETNGLAQERWYENMYGVYKSTTLTATLLFTHIPTMQGLIDSGKSHNSTLTALFATMADSDKDMVWVQPVDDYSYQGWHKDGFVKGCELGNAEGNHNGSLLSDNPALVVPFCTGTEHTLAISNFIQYFDDNMTEVTLGTVGFDDLFNGYGELSTLSLTINSPGVFALAPLYEPDLIGSFVAVVGVEKVGTEWQLFDNYLHTSNKHNDALWGGTLDSAGLIGGSSACGAAKNWCLAAPVDFDLAVIEPGYYYKRNSIAASFVSGALALVRDRYPSQPMSVALAILFETADDIGEKGVDELYGHGVVNISAAMKYSGQLTMSLPLQYFNVPDEYNNSGVLLMDTSANLPLALQGLYSSMTDLDVAVEYLPGKYYNLSMVDLFDISEEEVELPQLGSAASDILKTSGTRETSMMYGFSLQQDEDDGRLLQMGYTHADLQLRYDMCGNCDNIDRTWDNFGFDAIQSASVSPYFVENEQRIFAQYGLSNNWSVFGGMGLQDDIESEANYTRFGLRFDSNRNISLNKNFTSSWYGEWSRIKEKDGILGGGEFSGGLELEDGATTEQWRAGLRTQIMNWTFTGDYEYGVGSAQGSGGVMGDVNYQYSGYRLGLQTTDLLRPNDIMRFGYHHHTDIDSGNAMIYRNSLVDGEIINTSSRIHWGGDNINSIHWAYGVRPTEHTEWALGLEHARNSDKKETAGSLLWKYRF